MLDNAITICNKGAAINSTNYFEHEHARHGLLFFSWNASTLRILVPDNQIEKISEMNTGLQCVISRGQYLGQDYLELMFDDESEEPFVIFANVQCVDRDLKLENQPFTVTAWTSQGLASEWIGRFRQVKILPCLAPWSAD